MHLLCALTPDQNVVGSVDCGLHLAVSYASLMPTQNPIDLWGQLLSGGRDQAARIKQRCQFKEVIATALTRYPPDLKNKKPLRQTPVESHPVCGWKEPQERGRDLT